MKARILIVDDHEIVREGIRTLLGRVRSEWEICGEAANSNEAIEAVKMQRPDLVVLDITMPVTSGLEVARQIRKLDPACRILMFTMHDSGQLGVEVRAADAQGYVLKSQAARDLVAAIETLLSGGTFFGSPNKDREPRPAKNKAASSSSKREALAQDKFSFLMFWNPVVAYLSGIRPA
jgi:DNA-binding NarL/FixJ family response regulator